MASQLDSIKKLPPAQLALIWILVAALLGLGWYFLYYEEAVTAREQSEVGLHTARGKLKKIKAKEAKFKENMAAVLELETEIEIKKQKLPLSANTVDHLMSKFEQEARLVGFAIDRWKPTGEQRKDFYARLPIEIEATATWHQTGEFFRRVSELTQIVNIERLRLSVRNKKSDTPSSLRVTFLASTFRLLTPKERAPAKKTRRGGK